MRAMRKRYLARSDGVVRDHVDGSIVVYHSPERGSTHLPPTKIP
jgi:hypothetical protein